MSAVIALITGYVVALAVTAALAVDARRDTRTRPAHRAPRARRAPRITAWARAHRPTWSAR